MTREIHSSIFVLYKGSIDVFDANSIKLKSLRHPSYFNENALIVDRYQSDNSYVRMTFNHLFTLSKNDFVDAGHNFQSSGIC